MRRMKGLRTRPSPCSPESAPPNSSTRSATSRGDALEFAHALLGLQVDHGPHVQTSDGCVRINSGGGSVRSREAARKRPMNSLQFFRSNSRVFDERDRLGVFLHRHRKAQRGFAKAPDSRLCRQGPSRRDSDSRSRARADRCFERDQVGAEDLPCGRHRIRRTVWPPDRRRSRPGGCLIERGVLPGIVQNGLVHHLDRRRLMCEE